MAKGKAAPGEDAGAPQGASPGRLVADRHPSGGAHSAGASGPHTVWVASELPTPVRAALEGVAGLARGEHTRSDVVVASGALPPPKIRPDGPAVLAVGDPDSADLGWLEIEVDHWVSSEAVVAAPELAVRRALATQLALRSGPGRGRIPWLHAVVTVVEASAAARVAPERADWWPAPVEGLPTDRIASAARTGAVVLATPEAVAAALDLPDPPVGALVALPLGPRVADGVLVAVSFEGGAEWARAAVPQLRRAAAAAVRETLVRRALAAETGRRWIEKVLHRLLSVVSHDLRNPLFAVQLGVKILERQHGRTEQIESIQSTIGTATQLLRRLVDAGRQVLEVPSVPPVGFGADLFELWSRVAEGSMRRHPGRPISGAPPASHVLVDPVMLERVLTAVLDNALQHGTGPDPVTVATRDENGAIVLEIRNKGRLPFVDSDRIEPFEHRSNGGIGVGLYLARRIATAAGIGLKVRQDGADVETTLTLPTR